MIYQSWNNCNHVCHICLHYCCPLRRDADKLIMTTQENNGTSIEQIANDFAKSFVESFSELCVASEQLAKAAQCCSQHIRTLAVSAIVRKMERLVHKHEQASFITRWYWKRRIKKLVSAIDELEMILNE